MVAPLTLVDDMAWATPQYSRTRVDAAADYLLCHTEEDDPGAWLGSLNIVSNWRSSHSWPLLSVRLSLTDRAKKLHANALIAQRLKRLPAILPKLRRFGRMKLTQMQDIGGCRAVLPTVRLVERLDRAYTKAAARRQKHQPECIERYDYVAKPKADGYRGIHLVYKYHTRLAKYEKHDGLRVEIQLRSQLQHEWATAVETVDLFTKQALKSSVGEVAWKRFFVLISAVFARKERRPIPSDTPDDPIVLRAELRDLAAQLRVEAVLVAWSFVVQELLPKKVSGARTFLLVLDIDKKQVTLSQYSLEVQRQANDDYLEVEKGILAGSGTHAVLVSVGSLQALKQAYPSFYADTTAFLGELREAINGDDA